MMKTSLRTMSALALAIATASSGAISAELEEVIVTAQKRAESLQDVPISMTAIGGEKISEAGIQSMTDLGSYVPNLGISENAVKQTEFKISDKDSVNKVPNTLPTEVVWLWELSTDSWLRVDLDKQEKEN